MQVLIPLRIHGRPDWRGFARLVVVLTSLGLAARGLVGFDILAQAKAWGPWLTSRIHALAGAALIAIAIPHLIVLANEWLYRAIKCGLRTILGSDSRSAIAVASVLIEILLVNLCLISSLGTRSPSISPNSPKTITAGLLPHGK